MIPKITEGQSTNHAFLIEFPYRSARVIVTRFPAHRLKLVKGRVHSLPHPSAEHPTSRSLKSLQVCYPMSDRTYNIQL